MHFFMIEYRPFESIFERIAELCNGSTADSDSVCWGSNPYSAAKKSRPSSDGLLFFLGQWNNGLEPQ